MKATNSSWGRACVAGLWALAQLWQRTGAGWRLCGAADLCNHHSRSELWSWGLAESKDAGS